MGFIGSNFILQARRQNKANIINLDKLTTCNPHSLDELSKDASYILIKGDIGDRNLVDRTLTKYQPDAVVNFAAESHVDRSIAHPQTFIETNIMGTFTLLEACRDYWQKLLMPQRSQFRFVQISTDEVYGSLSATDLAFTEASPYRPNNPYAATKASADHLGRSFYHTYGLPILTTCGSNNYGARQFPEKFIPLIIMKALARQPLPIYGDGLNIRDWLEVEEHCEAIFLVLERGLGGETYNIGGNNQLTNLEVVNKICIILDKLIPFVHADLITFVSDRLGHDRRYALNCEKIKNNLGWQPHTDFDDGLVKTIKWYRANFEWLEQINAVRI
jgi:dTDP-glucose 4,6-dehydratase